MYEIPNIDTHYTRAKFLVDLGYFRGLSPSNVERYLVAVDLERSLPAPWQVDSQDDWIDANWMIYNDPTLLYEIGGQLSMPSNEVLG